MTCNFTSFPTRRQLNSFRPKLFSSTKVMFSYISAATGKHLSPKKTHFGHNKKYFGNLETKHLQTDDKQENILN